MTSDSTPSLFLMIKNGGFVMIPLLICSLVGWAVMIERAWTYWKLGRDLKVFHFEAIRAMLHHSPNTSVGGQTQSQDGVYRRLGELCAQFPTLPTARLVAVALERLQAQDARVRKGWLEAVERQRQLLNQEMKRSLWILGTIGSSAPFIGLFGTVVGILESFQNIAQTGSGGFAVVASGISEALIATAAGIVVAVIAVMAFNAFQTRWSALVLQVRIHCEELAELLAPPQSGDSSGA